MNELCITDESHKHNTEEKARNNKYSVKFYLYNVPKQAKLIYSIGSQNNVYLGVRSRY